MREALPRMPSPFSTSTTLVSKLDCNMLSSLDSIQIEELKALLLHCNLQLEEEAYEDYLAKYYELQRPQTVEKEDFLNVFQLILKNQSPYFRQLYKRKGHESGQKGQKPIDFKGILDQTRHDIRSIFEAYDVNQNGFIEYEELRELLIDLGLDAVFFDMNGVIDGSEANEEMPEQSAAFEEYVRAVWDQYDNNKDGFLSFEEFIPVHSDLIDK